MFTGCCNKKTPYPSHFSYLNASGYVFHMDNNITCLFKDKDGAVVSKCQWFSAIEYFQPSLNKLAFVTPESEAQHSYMLRHHSLPFSVEPLQE